MAMLPPLGANGTIIRKPGLFVISANLRSVSPTAPEGHLPAGVTCDISLAHPALTAPEPNHHHSEASCRKSILADRAVRQSASAGRPRSEPADARPRGSVASLAAGLAITSSARAEPRSGSLSHRSELLLGPPPRTSSTSPTSSVAVAVPDRDARHPVPSDSTMLPGAPETSRLELGQRPAAPPPSPAPPITSSV